MVMVCSILITYVIKMFSRIIPEIIPVVFLFFIWGQVDFLFINLIISWGEKKIADLGHTWKNLNKTSDLKSVMAIYKLKNQ